MFDSILIKILQRITNLRSLRQLSAFSAFLLVILFLIFLTAGKSADGNYPTTIVILTFIFGLLIAFLTLVAMLSDKFFTYLKDKESTKPV